MESESKMPVFKSKNCLVQKHMTNEIYQKLRNLQTANGFTLDRATSSARELENQSVGIYAGDRESYELFGDVFEPIICEYHNVAHDRKHASDFDLGKITGEVKCPIKSTRIRVGRNVEGFALSPCIGREERLELEALMKEVFAELEGDLKGSYYPLMNMEEEERKMLIDEHVLFISGDPTLVVAGMERDWPEGRGVFISEDRKFSAWVNEEDQLRIVSMEKGSNAVETFARLKRGVEAIGELILRKTGKKFQFDERNGFIHSCPTNLGTGMRASVHVDLPGWKVEHLKKRAKELGLQVRGTRGESGGIKGSTYDISNRHRLGYSEVQLLQVLIDGINKLYEEDLKLQGL